MMIMMMVIRLMRSKIMMMVMMMFVCSTQPDIMMWFLLNGRQNIVENLKELLSRETVEGDQVVRLAINDH